MAGSRKSINKSASPIDADFLNDFETFNSVQKDETPTEKLPADVPADKIEIKVPADKTESTGEAAADTQKKRGRKKVFDTRPNVAIQVLPEEKAQWMKVFAAHDLSLAQGIRKAVRHYIHDLQTGRIES